MDTTLPLSVATIQQTWTYDDEGRVASHTQNSDTLEAIGAGGRTLGYTYDANGRRQTVTYPGGATIEYEYDADGRTTAIKRNATSLATYAYDPTTGRLATRTLANGVTTSYGYNFMGRTTSITVTSGAATLWEATYGYDAVGNRTWSKYGTQGDAYAYDATYQVTGVKYGSATPESGYAAITDAQGSSTWTYDPAGNRTQQTVTGTVPGVDPATTSYTANDINSYTSVTEDSTPVNIAHSSRADLSAFGDWTYTNDVYGNIIQAANGTQTVRFYFDGANKRVGKEIDTDGAIWWLHDGIHLVEEYDSVTSQTTEYIYEPGIDRPLAKIEGGVTKFFHQDVFGNVVALTNGGGDLVEEYRYDIWGNFEAFDQNGDPIQGDPESLFLFTARQWDSEPGLYYYRARSYSQTLGRFMQQDPIGFAGGDLNLVRYVANSSVNAIDPLGLMPFHWYGNYGGPGYTNGNWEDAGANPSSDQIGPPHGPEPINSQDECYLEHDKCYAKCKKDECLTGDELRQCKRSCDDALQACLVQSLKSGDSGNPLTALGAYAAFSVTNHPPSKAPKSGHPAKRR